MDSPGRRPRLGASQAAPARPGSGETVRANLDRAIQLLVRAAYDDSDEPAVPEELVARILRSRDGNHADWINALTGLVASPLLALSIGI